MIKVFGSSDRTFASNGDKVLKPIKAVILKEDNGDYSLTLETSIADNRYIQSDNIVVCDTPWGEQGFRVVNPYKRGNKITCECKHLYFDGDRYLIADSYVVDKNCNDAIDHLNTATDTASPFTTFSNVQGYNSYRCVRKSLTEAFSAVMERWGGHLMRDNFNVSILSSIGKDNGVTLRYGKNITDISANEDWRSVVTKLLPVGKDGLLLPELYITTSDIPSGDQNFGREYDNPYTRTVSFTQDIDEDDYKTDGVLDSDGYQAALIADLRKQAINYVQTNCVPKVTYTVKANIQKVTDVGDTIAVYHEKLGIDMITHVISVKWDCIQERYVEVNFGNFENKLKNLIGNVTGTATKEVKDEINNTVLPAVNDKLTQAYDKIWNALGASYCIYEGDQILVVDKLPKDTAKNCIRINSAGIAFSRNGINGKFTSAWAIDGTFDAQNINIVNLVADMIKGGTLKLGSEIQQHGKIELYNEANRLIGQMNKDGLTMWANDGSYIKINNEVGFAGYDKNGDKVYWCDGAVFCTQKFVAKDEITVGGKLRMLPITTDTNSGIGFVAIFEE